MWPKKEKSSDSRENISAARRLAREPDDFMQDSILYSHPEITIRRQTQQPCPRTSDNSRQGRPMNQDSIMYYPETTRRREVSQPSPSIMDINRPKRPTSQDRIVSFHPELTRGRPIPQPDPRVSDTSCPGRPIKSDMIGSFRPEMTLPRNIPQPGPRNSDTSRPARNTRPIFCISPTDGSTTFNSPGDIELHNCPPTSRPTNQSRTMEDRIERVQTSQDTDSGIRSPEIIPAQSAVNNTPAAPEQDTDKITPAAGTCESQKELFEFLEKHLNLTHEYVLTQMNLSEIELLYMTKIQLEQNKTTALLPEATWEDFGNSDYLALVRELLEENNEENFTLRLAEYVNKILHGNAYRIYKLSKAMQGVVKVYTYDIDDKIILLDSTPHAHILEAAKRASCMYSSRNHAPLDLIVAAKSVFLKKLNKDKLVYAMAVPILIANGEVSHVIEVWRSNIFMEYDLQIGDSFMVWGSLANRFCTIMTERKKDSELKDFLLSTVKSIFEDMVSLDQVIKRILQFAQKLVDADRASLFLVDHKNNELVSTVFDLQLSNDNDTDSKEKKEIRMPIHRGIAGHVAVTGDYVNISDAYSDVRFNSEVDEATGYKTTSILCMPVKIEGVIIGVVQMVNKRNAEKFSHEDVKSFKIFASFFGLALHHARLYDKIARNEQKYRVALEVLSYHNTCRESEVSELVSFESDLIHSTLSNYYLDPFTLNVLQKCRSTIIMFDDLFNMKNFDAMNVTRFILTVKKNYRDVPYHNFHHGWSVAQTMYAILKSDVSKHFSYKQRLALFVASLCHDLDHRGYTNKYMSETASPLAAMYTTSTLEHHHFNITVTILQQDGHNIFSRFTSKEYKDILGLIRTCILATDLATFFPNLAKMKHLCCTDNQVFNWNNSQHRELAMAMSMTAADLSASAKPWNVQNKTVKVIFEEFYSQGDKERAAGRTPIPMMDRNKPEEQPASQVGFLTQICLPCYQILVKILPNTADLHKMACQNLKIWKEKAKEVAEQKDLQNKPGPSGTQKKEEEYKEIPWEQEANVNQEFCSDDDVNYEDSWSDGDDISSNETNKDKDSEREVFV